MLNSLYKSYTYLCGCVTMKRSAKKQTKKKLKAFFLIFFFRLGRTLIKCSITIIMSDLAVAVAYYFVCVFLMKNILLISSFYLCSLLVTHF